MSTEQFDDLEGAVQGSTRRTTLKGIAAALGAAALASPLAVAAQDVDAAKRCRRGYPGPIGDEGTVGPKGPVGVFIAGPTGPTAAGGVTAGATGPAGDPGSSVGPQLVRVSNTGTVTPSSGATVTVQCPSGAQILSWGFDTANVTIAVSGAAVNENPDFVNVSFVPVSPSTGGTVTAYALCATSGLTPTARRAGSDKGKGRGRGKSAGKRGRNDNRKK